MSDFELPAEAVEAAAKAQWEAEGVECPWGELIGQDRDLAVLYQEAAIRAFLDAMGVTVEWSQLGVSEGDPTIPGREVRLVSDWRPVDAP